jgi:hypothetical protein
MQSLIGWSLERKTNSLRHYYIGDLMVGEPEKFSWPSILRAKTFLERNSSSSGNTVLASYANTRICDISRFSTRAPTLVFQKLEALQVGRSNTMLAHENASSERVGVTNLLLQQGIQQIVQRHCSRST